MLIRRTKYLILILLLVLDYRLLHSQISIDTSFEGANAHVLIINNSTNTIKIESNFRNGDTRNVVFYCKLSGFNITQPFKIQVQNSQSYYLPILAAYSYNGTTWFRISGTLIGNVKEFSNYYSQNSIYFSVGYPYVYSDMLNLLNSISSSQFVQISSITNSSGGRSVKLIRITEPCVPDSSKYLVWVLGRNHSMESHSNYVVDGFVDFAISNDMKADLLRRQSIIYVVPIMDVDMASIGGTGKDQLPVDFNRDWGTPSFWQAVIAVKQKIAETTIQNPIKIFWDSHNPFPGSPNSSERLFVYSLYNSGPKSLNIDFFRKLFQENSNYPMDRQPMYATDGQSSFRYVDSMYSTIEISLSTETGWVNRTDNVEWTIPLYKFNGASIGRAFNDYFSNLPKAGDIIIDNTDSSNVVITGEWFASTNIGGYWGTNYLHDGNIGKGNKSVKYIPQIMLSGDYEVFLRWTQDAGRANNVPIKVTYNGGVKDTIVNQQMKGAEWVTIGMFNFTAGNFGNVLIQNEGTQGYVIADAVRFSKRNNCNPIGVKSDYIPSNFSLKIFPNPFNPTTTIKYVIPSGNSSQYKVHLIIYDLLGRELKVLVNEYQESGEYSVVFDGNTISSGVYFYKFVIMDRDGLVKFTTSGKLILIK